MSSGGAGGAAAAGAGKILVVSVVFRFVCSYAGAKLLFVRCQDDIMSLEFMRQKDAAVRRLNHRIEQVTLFSFVEQLWLALVTAPPSAALKLCANRRLRRRRRSSFVATLGIGYG